MLFSLMEAAHEESYFTQDFFLMDIEMSTDVFQKATQAYNVWGIERSYLDFDFFFFLFTLVVHHKPTKSNHNWSTRKLFFASNPHISIPPIDSTISRFQHEVCWDAEGHFGWRIRFQVFGCSAAKLPQETPHIYVWPDVFGATQMIWSESLIVAKKKNCLT